MSHKSTILIVDDEPIGRQLIDAILYKEGYNLEFAENGREAFDKAKALNPDLILLDVMMPEIDGFEVCQMMRNDESMVNIPIILVTALDDIDSRIRGLEAGADDYISKPFDRLELLARIKIITRLNRYRKSENGEGNGEVKGTSKQLSNDLLNKFSDITSFSFGDIDKVFPETFTSSIFDQTKNTIICNGTEIKNSKHFYFSGSTKSEEETALSLLLSSILSGSIIKNSNIASDINTALNNIPKELFLSKEELNPFLCSLKVSENDTILEYTGLNNSIFLINNKGISKIKGESCNLKTEELKIETKEISIEKGDRIISCSCNIEELSDEIRDVLFQNAKADMNIIQGELHRLIEGKEGLAQKFGKVFISGITF